MWPNQEFVNFLNESKWQKMDPNDVFSPSIVFLWHWLKIFRPKTSINQIAAKTVAFSYCCLWTNLQLPVLSTTVFDVDMLPHFSSSSMQWLDVLNGTLQPSRRSCWVLLPLASHCFHPPSRPPTCEAEGTTDRTDSNRWSLAFNFGESLKTYMFFLFFFVFFWKKTQNGLRLDFIDGKSMIRFESKDSPEALTMPNCRRKWPVASNVKNVFTEIPAFDEEVGILQYRCFVFFSTPQKKGHGLFILWGLNFKRLAPAGSDRALDWLRLSSDWLKPQ